MSRQEFNLEIISNQYRKKGVAAKAFKNLSLLISSNDTRNLKNILRDHRDEPIWENYLINERDNIDCLIEYYAILEIGIIANYFPSNLPTSLKKEIENILDNEYVRRYYSKYYPLVLPQLLLKHVSVDKVHLDDDTTNKIQSNLFEKFLVLNQTIKSDKDVDQFLWFLDDGYTQDYSIHDLLNVLLDRKTISYKLGRSNTHPLNSALFGFIKYIQFLNEYTDLLKQASDFKQLQSSFWHYQSYWFGHMKDQLGDIIKVALNNIRKTMNNTSETELVSDKNSFINNKDDFNKLKSTTDQLVGIEDDINYLLNPSLGDPLNELLN